LGWRVGGGGEEGGGGNSCSGGWLTGERRGGGGRRQIVDFCVSFFEMLDDLTRRVRFSLSSSGGSSSTDVSDWEFSDVLEVVGGSVHGFNSFNLLMEERNWWEIWTIDYIKRFASYIDMRVNEEEEGEKEKEKEKGKKQTIVLEICAGDGRLTKYLETNSKVRERGGEVRGFLTPRKNQKST